MTIPSAHRRAHPSARRGSATSRTGRGGVVGAPACAPLVADGFGPLSPARPPNPRRRRRCTRVWVRRPLLRLQHYDSAVHIAAYTAYDSVETVFFFFFVLVPSCARLHFLPVHYYRLFLFSVGVLFIFFFVTANIIPVDTLYLIVRSFPRCFSRIEFSSHATAPTVHHHQTR